MDLPGHGESDPAKDPHKTYNIPGYAEVAMEVIRKLDLTNLIVVGSSLGGHIGLSMVAKGQKLAGLLITGTPPIPLSAEGFTQGFRLLPRIHTLFSQPTFTETEAEEFMVEAGGFDKEKDRNIIQAAMKTDRQARPLLAASFQNGPIEDQRALVETDETPLCIVQGIDDACIINEYIQSLNYKNLFNQVYLLPSDHGCFRKLPTEFNAILSLFIETVTSKDNSKKRN